VSDSIEKLVEIGPAKRDKGNVVDYNKLILDADKPDNPCGYGVLRDVLDIS